MPSSWGHSARGGAGRADTYSARSSISPLVLFLVATASFLLGRMSSFNLTTRFPTLFPTFKPSTFTADPRSTLASAPAPVPPPRVDASTAATNVQQPQPPQAQHAPQQQIPLGLQWLRLGQQNPWSFSVLRHSVHDLAAVVQSTLTANDDQLPRVVVTMTSLPRRLSLHTMTALRVLSQQTYMPDAIYVVLPKRARRSNATYDIPPWMSAHPLVTILRPEVDYGPATKLIPTLREELRLGHTTSRVVTIDDDNEGRWQSDTLLNMFAYSLLFPDAAIGATGWNVTCMLADARCSPADSGIPERQFPNRLYNFIRAADDMACHSLADWLPDYYANCLGAVRKNHVAFADVLEGYKGVVYQPRFFDLDQLDSIVGTNETEGFLLCDDVWFSGWLSVRKVPRLVISPAIHKDATVYKLLQEFSDAKVKRRKLNLNEKELGLPSEEGGALDDSEKGLHSLGDTFTRANHDGVLWFEKQGGWVKGLWDRPEGFQFNSDVAVKAAVEEEGIGKETGEGSLAAPAPAPAPAPEPEPEVAPPPPPGSKQATVRAR